MDVEQGRHQVHGLGQRPAAAPGQRRVVGVMHKQGDMRHLVVAGHHVLGPPVVLAQQEAVVGGDDKRGVVPHRLRVHVVDKAPELVIAQGHDGGVVGADLFALRRPLGDPRIGRPVEDRAAVAGGIGLAEFGRRMKRLMRIEGFKMQQPVVRGAVALQELEPGIEAAHRRKILVLADELAIDHVARQLVAALLGELVRVVHLAQALPGRLDHRLPWVALLAADEIVGVVAVVISGAAVAPVVKMVRDQVRIDALLVQQRRERVVEGFQRAPAAVQEIQAPGMQVAPRRHARQAAHVVLVEGDALRSQAAEVRCGDRFTAVRRKGAPVERIEQDEDGAHEARFPLLLVLDAAW